MATPDDPPGFTAAPRTEGKGGEASAVRALLNALPARAALIDSAGRIVLANESWQQAGRENGPTAAFFSLAGDNFLTAGLRTESSAAIQLQIIGGGASRVLEGSQRCFTHEFAGGRETPARWYRVVISPLEGRDRGAVVMYLDITDHREMEERLREQAASLSRPRDAKVVTERKKLEADLLRAQRLESIGTLASGIAHDLNNVLAPILMSIDLLADEHLVEPQRSRILDGLRRSAQRGSTMVRQVLSFARGMEGPQVPVRPSTLLDELTGIVRETFPKAIQLAVEQAEMPSWTICGDSTQLHQALLNLCVNARDAMPKGGTLTLRTECRMIDESYAAMNPDARPGPHVIISVSDTGTGIRPELREKIFDPFFTTKEVGTGTGLGLSTVLAIVRSHRGFVQLESEMNRGSTFRIHLPASDAKAEETAASPGSVAPFGGGELILVVDDEEVILDISRKTLEKRGYRVLTAPEGATAVALYAKHRGEIAAVLTDMMMPVMDGLSTLRALRHINPDVKVIAASGLSSNMNPAKVSDAGIRYFLNKPYRAETLLKTLREAIDSREPQAAN